MYKTVRKGDASLQYMILPQSDQFNSNGLSQTKSTIPTNRKLSLKILKYLICTLLVIAFFCVVTRFLNNQSDHNLFAGTILVMGRVGYETTTTTTTTTKTMTAMAKATTMTTTMATSSTSTTGSTSTTTENALKSDKVSEEEEEDEEEEEEEEIAEKNRYEVPVTTTRPRTTTIMITSTSASLKNKDFDDQTMPIDSFRNDKFEPADTISPEDTVVDEERFPTESSMNSRQSNSYSSFRSFLSSTQSSESSKSSLSSIEPSEMTKTSSGIARKGKMPRVTLKLRENETIPQMYMKAGIASYKKGNITTSVLAHGLSLEGLIFKTPEGTIKPWAQKWFFSGPSSDFQWKGPNQMPMSMYVLLTGLAGLASLSIILMFYVQRKTSRRQRHDVEEPETEVQEEDKSTLLGTDYHEIEDKE